MICLKLWGVKTSLSKQIVQVYPEFECSELSEESLSVRWQILAQDHVVLSSVVFTGKKLPLTTLFQSLIKLTSANNSA
ncbi:hypothetical protein pipiens_010295 [Culex pipiens pipiens]|uniref:Uncharacterized protein n=1 Tax=Culex pipiens pipiens TaxID=38569 RepID=A0ABD1DAR5_CULPP